MPRLRSGHQRGELRFGERLPNPFAEGEMTVWFHPLCAAYKRFFNHIDPYMKTMAQLIQVRFGCAHRERWVPFALSLSKRQARMT